MWKRYSPHFESESKRKKFPVWEMILLHFLAEIKEMAVVGATFDILYKLLPKEIIIVRRLDSYTT